MIRTIGFGQMAMSAIAFTLLSLPVQAAEPPAATDRFMSEARDRIDTTTTYTARQKEAFQRKAQVQLAALQQQIAALQTRIGDASEATRADLQASIDDLDKKRQRAKHKMEELRSATDATWEDVKSAASRALDDVQAAYRKALTLL